MGKGKIFNTNNYFNQSKEEIKDNHREEYFTDYSDKHFTNARCNYHGIKDNWIMFINKNVKNKIQRDIISIKETMQSKVDSTKRGAFSW